MLCSSPLAAVLSFQWPSIASWRTCAIQKKPLTKLRSLLAINRRARPVIGPGDIAVLAQRNHGLNRKSHAGLALSHRLVLGVVGDVGRAVEQRVDAVAAVRADDAAVPLLCNLFDNVAKLADERARLDGGDGGVEAVAGSFHNADRVRVGLGAVADVVRLVEVAVVALEEEGDVDVEDVAVEEHALVGDAVADDLVEGCAYGLGEVVVVQGRGVGLRFGLVSFLAPPPLRRRASCAPRG